jgi:hypothetical protein
LRYLDPWGLEKIIISGGAYDVTGYNYEFVDSALREIQKTRETSNEPIALLIADAGWTKEQRGYFQEAVSPWDDVVVEIVPTVNDIVYYINKHEAPPKLKETKDMDSGRYINYYANYYLNYFQDTTISDLSDKRKNDPITSVYVFSHGLPGQIALGYHHTNAGALAFTTKYISMLNSEAFSDTAYFHLFSCRAGSTKGGEPNFAQMLADRTGKDVIAPYSGDDTEGRTDYEGILGLQTSEFLMGYFSGLFLGSSDFKLGTDKMIQTLEYRSITKQYEKERKSAVGGVAKPYPALNPPTLSTNQATETNAHWVTYKTTNGK